MQAIQIYREDIFDTAEDSWLARALNGLHIMTRASVVRRELLFRAGEPYDSALVAETARNLRRLKIFRNVEVDSASTPGGLVVWIKTRDGWSTRPELQYKSTGSDKAYSLGIIELNLFGTASQVAARYKQDTDRSSVQLSVRQPRLFASKVMLDLYYHDLSDGNAAGIRLEQPFLSLSSPSQFSLQAATSSGRVLQFRDGNQEPFASFQRRQTIGRIELARSLRASSAGYVRFGVYAHVFRHDLLRDSTPGPFPSTVRGTLGPILDWRTGRYRVTEGLQGFGRKEDVDISTTVRAGLLLAPRLFGYDRDGFGALVGVQIGKGFDKGFLTFGGALAGLLSTGIDSGTVSLSSTLVLQPLPQQNAVFHASIGWKKNPVPGGEFDLGLGFGPRAFGAHAFTGDRYYFTTANYRYALKDDLWNLLGVGLAGFADHGGAWFSDSRVRTGTDVGVGLRLGQIRSTDSEPMRIDVARRFATDVQEAGWVLVVGKGWVF